MTGKKPDFSVCWSKGKDEFLHNIGAAWQNEKSITVQFNVPVAIDKCILIPKKESE